MRCTEPLYPFPISVSDEAEQYSVKRLRETLAQHGRFVVPGNGSVSMRWVMWLARRTELAGWNCRRYSFDAVEDIVFERSRFVKRCSRGTGSQCCSDGVQAPA